MFSEDVDAHAAVEQAVLELDPAGKMIKGAPATVYAEVIAELASCVEAGDMLLPSLVASIFYKYQLPLDIEDVRELSRRIGVKLGFA